MKKRPVSEGPSVDAPGSPEFENFKEAVKKIVQTPKKVVDAREAEWKTRKNRTS